MYYEVSSLLFLMTGFPHVLETVENNILEMSLNFTKSGNVLEKILPVKKNPLRRKKSVNK